MMKLLFFLLTFSIVLGDLLRKDEKTNKMEYIRFSLHTLPLNINSQETLYLNPPKSPKLNFANTDNLIDYCTHSLESIKRDYIYLWNNFTFCQKMFCEEENILYQKFLNNSRDESLKLIYLSSFYICKYCKVGMNQTFVNGTFDNCKWNKVALFNSETKSFCNESIYIGENLLCYIPVIDQYVNYPFDFAIFMSFLMNDIHPMSIMVVFIFLFILTIFINLIPLIYDTIQKIRKDPLIETSTKFFTIFSIQNINLVFIMTIEMVIIITGGLDRLFLNASLLPLGYFIGYFLFGFTFANFIMVFSRASQSDNLNRDSITIKDWLLILTMYPILLILFLLGVVIIVVSYIYPDLLTITILASWKLLTSICLFIMGITLFFFTLAIFVKLSFDKEKKRLVDYLKFKVILYD